MQKLISGVAFHNRLIDIMVWFDHLYARSTNIHTAKWPVDKVKCYDVKCHITACVQRVKIMMAQTMDL